jgi:hypothetical protein
MLVTNGASAVQCVIVVWPGLCSSVSSLPRNRTRKLSNGLVCCADEERPVSECLRRASLLGCDLTDERE